MSNSNTILICVEDRYFEKLENLERIPVKVEEIKPGDTFMMYEDSTKKTVCHWNKFDVFKCVSDELTTNECDCRYMACEAYGKINGPYIQINPSSATIGYYPE